MLRRSSLALWLALAIYAAYRALVLYTAFDAVCLPNYELYMGNIGKVTLEGGYGPPLYQYYDNCGGHLATGLFAMPFFALFGQSYLALKFVPVVLGALSMLLIWAILKRHFGVRAAALGVLLFAIGPPTLAKYSMLAKGNHFENLFFQLAVLWCFLRLHQSERRGPWLFACGALAGFAIFFYFGSLALLALLALTHLVIRRPHGVLLDLRHALPGVALGLSPLIWVHLNSNFRPGGFLDAKLGGEARHGLGVALERMQRLMTDYLPRGGCFEDLGPLPASVAEWTWLGAWVLAFVVLAPPTLAALVRACGRRDADSARSQELASSDGLRSSSSQELPQEQSQELPRGPRDAQPCGVTERTCFDGLKSAPLLAFLPTFVLLYGFSTFEFKPYGAPVEIGQFRYLVPHYTFSCLLIAIAAARLWRSERAGVRGLGWVLATASLATSLFSLPVIELDGRSRGLGTRYDGFEFAYQNNVLQRDTILDEVSGARSWDLERLRAQLLDFPLPERVRTAIGVGNYLAWAQSMPPIKRASAPRPAGLNLTQLLEPFPEELQLDLARGAGSFLRGSPRAREVAERRLRTRLPELLAEGHPQLAHLVSGLAEDPGFPLARNTRAELTHDRWLGQFVPAQLRWAWWRGQGMACGQLIERGIESDLRAVDAFLESAREAPAGELWFGIGFGVGEKLEDARLPVAFAVRARALAPEPRTAAFRGLGAGLRHALAPEPRATRFAALRAGLEPGERAALEFGARWPDYPLPLKL